MTDYHVEVEQKRLGRRVAELKFRITKIQKIPIQESVFPDIENLPPIALELVQARIDRNPPSRDKNRPVLTQTVDFGV